MLERMLERLGRSSLPCEADMGGQAVRLSRAACAGQRAHEPHARKRRPRRGHRPQLPGLAGAAGIGARGAKLCGRGKRRGFSGDSAFDLSAADALCAAGGAGAARGVSARGDLPPSPQRRGGVHARRGRRPRPVARGVRLRSFAGGGAAAGIVRTDAAAGARGRQGGRLQRPQRARGGRAGPQTRWRCWAARRRGFFPWTSPAATGNTPWSYWKRPRPPRTSTPAARESPKSGRCRTAMPKEATIR